MVACQSKTYGRAGSTCRLDARGVSYPHPAGKLISVDTVPNNGFNVTRKCLGKTVITMILETYFLTGSSRDIILTAVTLAQINSSS